MTKTTRIVLIASIVVLAGAAAAFFVFNLPLSTVFFGLMVLVCPLSHVFMMKFMGHSHGDGEHESAAGHSMAGHGHCDPPKDLKENANNR
jgi:hypothetical protein